MTKAVITTGDIQNAFINLRNIINGNLGLDNFRGRIISGTTNATAHTEQLFKHGMTPRPIIVWPLTGNIYTHIIDSTNIDIRSSQTAVDFVAFAISGKLEGLS